MLNMNRLRLLLVRMLRKIFLEDTGNEIALDANGLQLN
jgi:hypothetical protein